MFKINLQLFANDVKITDMFFCKMLVQLISIIERLREVGPHS